MYSVIREFPISLIHGENMKKLLVFLIAAFLTSALILPGRQHHSTDNPFTSRNVDPLKTYWGDVDGFLDRQSQAALDVVQELLLRFPPALDEPLERQAAMLQVDTVLHDQQAPTDPRSRNFPGKDESAGRGTGYNKGHLRSGNLEIV